MKMWCDVEMEQLKQATVTNQYRDILILHLDALTIMYRDVLRDYAKSVIDEERFNECLTEMIVILDHLYPKLEGGGERTKFLLKEFDDFISWTENVMIPKINIEEQKKLHRLYKLILKAYDVLGLSNY